MRALILSILMASAANAAEPAAAVSKPIEADECAVTYQPKAGNFEFKIIKKAEAKKHLKTLPADKSPVACGTELQSALKISAVKCEIFCNPN